MRITMFKFILLTCILFIGAANSRAERTYDVDTFADTAGLEALVVTLPADSTNATDSLLILRIDPSQHRFTLLAKSLDRDSTDRDARTWADDHNLLVAANAGMFHQDYTTHVGYMKVGSEVISPYKNHYRSAAAFSPHDSSLPSFRIYDLDVDSLDWIIEQYEFVVQNLRLIKRPGENRWSQQDREWSEIALAEDSSGRALFIFSRRAMSMYNFNELLLDLPLGIVAAQHLEGGPEAQLYFEIDGASYQVTSSFEHGIFESDTASKAWPIPNVIGVER